MKPRALSSRLFSCLVLLALVLPAALPTASPVPIWEPDPSVVDVYLQDILGSTSGDELMEVVVQFEDGILPRDRERVLAGGLTIRHEYTIIPAMWLDGTAGQVERLASYDRIA